MRRLSLFIPLALLFYPYVSANSASFNCSKATTTNEKHVCSNPTLSDLDEAYFDRYRKMRMSFSDTKKIQQDAMFALKERDRHCTNVQCLKSWYAKRITLYDLRLNEMRAEEISGRRIPAKTNDAPISVEPHPVTLFYSLNLRSFENHFKPTLATDCNSYLSDYASNWEMKKATSTGYTFGNGKTQFLFTLLNNNQLNIISFQDNKLEPHSSTVNISYSSSDREWHGTQPIMGKSDSCRTDAYKLLKHQDFSSESDETQHSVGEISLSTLPVNQVGPVTIWDGYGVPAERPYHASRTPIYNAIKGKKIGELGIDVYSDSVDGSIARAVLVDDFGLRVAKAKVYYKNKHFPTMLVFKKQSSWYRLTDDNSNMPVWINAKTAHPSLLKAYKSREQVLADAKNVRVRSPHRLRSNPNTESDILRVLENNTNNLIFPLVVKNDWLKVIYITPHPGMYTANAESLMSLGDNYTKQVGWLKWRKSPTEQYIDF